MTFLPIHTKKSTRRGRGCIRRRCILIFFLVFFVSGSLGSTEVMALFGSAGLVSYASKVGTGIFVQCIC